MKSSICSNSANPLTPAIINNMLFSPDGTGWTIAHRMVKDGHRFSISELLLLGNPATWYGWTIAHEMAGQGHLFSVDDLLELQNPALTSDSQYQAGVIDMLRVEGWTVAHEMIYHSGYEFSIEELKRLGNPQDVNGWSLAHLMAINNHYFSDDELIELSNSSDFRDAEEMGAHITYRNGMPVFADGIELGNQVEISFGDVIQLAYEPPVFSYFLTLVNENGRWFVKIDEESFFPIPDPEGLSQKPMIERVASYINNSLNCQKGYNFTKDVNFWKSISTYDNPFRFSVRESINIIKGEDERY